MSDTVNKLSELAEKTLELVKAELDELQDLRDGEAERPMSQKAKRAHRVRVLNVTRALPGLVKEVRQLTKDNEEWAGNLGYDDKRRVIVEFFREMPQEHQRALVQELTRVLNERRSA